MDSLRPRSESEKPIHSQLVHDLLQEAASHHSPDLHGLRTLSRWAMSGSSTPPSFVSEALQEDLYNSLRSEYSQILFEGSELALLGTLTGHDASPGSFEPIGGWEGLFGLSPVLLGVTSNLIQVYQNELTAVESRLKCCAKDTGRQASTTSVSKAMSDLHLPGGHVRRLGFGDSTTLIYKPRSMSGEVLWRSLSDWLTQHGQSVGIAAATWSRQDYGWMEDVSSEAEPANSREYNVEMGAILAVALALNTNDLHAENILCNSGRPALVDAETLWQPAFGLEAQEHRLSDPRWLAERLQRSCLLKAEMPLPSGGLRLVGALDPRKSLGSVTARKEASTDRDDLNIRNEWLVEGFCAALSIIQRRTDELICLLRNAAPSFRSRVVLISTQGYVAIRQRARSRENFANFETWVRALSYSRAIHCRTYGTAQGESIAQEETHALSMGAIPRFEIDCQSLQLLNELGQPVCNLAGLTAFESTSQFLKHLRSASVRKAGDALRQALLQLSN